MPARTHTVLATATLALLASAGLAQPSFQPGTTLATPERPGGAAIADVNNDGAPDIVVSTDTPDKLTFLINDGLGGFSVGASVFTGAGTGPDSIQAGDFDADGDDDLAVVLNNTNTLAIYTNNAGVFTQTATAPLGDEARRLQAFDIDNDGDLDFATANRSGVSVSIVTYTAGALSTTNIPVANEPRGVALGDLDGDLDGDMVAGLRDSRQLAVFTNNAGVFAQTATLNLGGQVRPDGVQIADLDGDGLADIFAATSGNGFNQVAVFYGTGAGFSGPAVIAVPGQDADTVRAADFDLDGDLDLAVTNNDSTMLVIIENQGARAFAAAATLTTGLNPQGIAMGDLDANGSPDLVTPNQDANTTSIFLNNAADTGGDCPADLTGSSDPLDPTYGIPDGVANSDDFFFYLDGFVAGTLAVCDVTGSSDPNDPSFGSPDGDCDADDFFRYLDLFVIGCQ
ncbi:MAG: FG-GAP-like repeat-containing protein [Phycisphaerales bacterium JB037]